MVAPIRRGSIYWADLEPVRGHEQAGKRPVLVLQNDIGNEFSPTTIVACITSAQLRAFPFVVRVPDGLLPKPSFVNCAHLRTLDSSRLHPEPLAAFDQQTMDEVDQAVRVSLGME